MLLLILIVIIVVIGYLIVILNASMNRIVFNPTKYHIWEPIIPYKKIMIEDRLSAWHFNNNSDIKSKTILFCHGNYGNISYSDFLIEICDRQKINLLIFDYSGFGYSKGTSDKKQICKDGESAYNYLNKTLGVDGDNIIVWGMSLGGAVATYIASRNHCSNLVLLSTFSSLDDIIIDNQFGYFANFLAKLVVLLTGNIPSKDRIQNVKCPIIIMHSKDDEVIPFMNAKRMYSKIHHNCKKFVEIKGGHVTPIISTTALKDFFDFCLLNSSECDLCDTILDRLPHKVGEYLEKERIVTELHKNPKKHPKPH